MLNKKNANRKPKITTLDSMFGLDEPMTDGSPITIPIDDNLIPYREHPFTLYAGERLEDMVHSVKNNGVLIPIIVRRLDTGQLEILAGHNRVNSSELAGLKEVPAIIKENLSDEDAWIYVIETNLFQRSFTDMSHSEKATVLAFQYSKMFSQGKRNDIQSELIALENHDKSTSCQVDTKLRSDEKLGQEYGLSQSTVARYLRVNELISPLKERLDKGKIAFMSAVSLSFLDERSQNDVEHSLSLNDFKLDMKKAEILRTHFEKGTLDDDSIYLILNGEIKKNPINKTPPVRVKHKVYSKFFPPETKEIEIEQTIEKALTLYFEKEKRKEKRKNHER